jgi:hypothetical protein
MIQFIQEAGWGFWPVAVFGAVSLFLALRYAIAPRRELLPLIIGFGVATVIAGLLGTVTGVQHSANYIMEVEADRRWIFLLGLRESLNNMVAALVVTAVTALAATVGSYRQVRKRWSSEVSRPQET